MVRLALTGGAMTLVFLAMALVVAMVVHVDVAPKTPLSREATPEALSAPADAVIMLQAAHVHIDRLGVSETLTEARDKQISMLTKDVDDTSLITGSPVKSMSKSKVPSAKDKAYDVALATSSIHTSAATFRGKLHFAVLRLAEHMGVQASSGFLIVLLVVFLIVLLALSSLMFSFPFRLRSQQGNASTASQSPKDIATVLEQRDRMLAHSSPSQQGARMYQRAPPPGSSGAVYQAAGSTAASLVGGSQPFLASEPPLSRIHMPVPREISETQQIMLSPRQTPTEQHHRQTAKPPPLCPSLVMPMSEAILGIQMYELAQLSAEGELNIVGMSGKPLLRAIIKKVGSARALEIAMPEMNSMPRAIIAPSPVASTNPDAPQGSRALEIRGMRGAFYGILEMRSSGACYVVKDGQTVLTIDGDAESLQLSLKSSVGLQLASVRCSTELFDDVDHVEIRVEPGVDTVLVVAVVLAVLLLSPYLPPVD